jgi:hypothetical protein
VDSNTIGWGVTGLGVVLVAVSVLADPLGIGLSPAFGWKQILGIVVGIALIFGGQYWRKKNAGGTR